MILALDLGTKTGWALSTHPAITSGVENFAQGKFSGGGQRFLAFERWLLTMLCRDPESWRLNDPHDARRITAVCFEAVRRHLGTDAAHVYGGLLAIVTKTCEEFGIPYEGVPVGTIKKHATGKGNAGKDDMIAAIEALGYRPADDNEADAIALLRYRLWRDKAA